MPAGYRAQVLMRIVCARNQIRTMKHACRLSAITCLWLCNGLHAKRMAVLAVVFTLHTTDTDIYNVQYHNTNRIAQLHRVVQVSPGLSAQIPQEGVVVEPELLRSSNSGVGERSRLHAREWTMAISFWNSITHPANR